MISLADSLPIDPGPDGRAALRAWLARFVEVYEHYGPVIRAWTEAEIGGSEFGRLGTDVLTEFSRVLTGRIRRSSSPDINAQIAALAVVAMIERFSYYVLSRQVSRGDEMLDTLATVTHAGLFAGRPSATDRWVMDRAVSRQQPLAQIPHVRDSALVGDPSLDEHGDVVGDAERMPDVLLDDQQRGPGLADRRQRLVDLVHHDRRQAQR